MKRSQLLDSSDRWGSPKLAYPGATLGYNSDGTLAWLPYREVPSSNAWWLYRPGSGPILVTSVWFNQTVGTGATFLDYQSFDGRLPGCAEFQTGTTNTGNVVTCTATNGGQNGLQCDFETGSGKHTYEALLMIPTNSDGTNTFVVRAGMCGQVNTTSGTDECLITADANADTHFKCRTSAASVSTSTTTSVVITAGTWYRLKIVVVDATSADFYIVKNDDWHSNGRSYGASVATHTTNIPGGGVAPLLGIKKSAGTTSRSLMFCFASCRREPSFSPGIAGSSPNTLKLGRNAGDGPALTPGRIGMSVRRRVDGVKFDYYRADLDAIPWRVWDLRVDCLHFSTLTSNGGTATPRSIVEKSLPPAVSLNTSSNAAGKAARACLGGATGLATITMDANSGTLVYAVAFRIPTLSTAANTHTADFGFMDTVTAEPAFGAWFSLDSNADTHIKCKTADGTTTNTQNSIVIAANTWYWCRITLKNNTTAVFEIATLDSAIATNTTTSTTNLPTTASTSFFPAAQIRKTAGGNGRSAEYFGMLAYQKMAA